MSTHRHGGRGDAADDGAYLAKLYLAKYLAKPFEPTELIHVVRELAGITGAAAR